MDQEKIMKIITEWDPVGLMSHAPDDEYSNEATMIYHSLNDMNNVHELANAIYNIFCKQFGKDIFNKDIKECIQIANKILK